MSSAQLPAALVVQACESYLQARHNRIKQESEQVIAHWTGAKTWFWGRPMTREQAEDYCRDELFEIQITGGAWAQRAEALLSTARMAKKCNTFVTVDSRMVECLESHFG
jgi:hypothetical protein